MPTKPRPVFMGSRVKPGDTRLIRILVFAGLTREPMIRDRARPPRGLDSMRRVGESAGHG